MYTIEGVGNSVLPHKVLSNFAKQGTAPSCLKNQVQAMLGAFPGG